MKKFLGKFGRQVKQYEKARRNYGEEVIKYLKKIISFKNPLILDLGCGTGISSRQLLKIGQVVGCDPDPIMLKAAQYHNNDRKIKYVLGKAEKLPFKNNFFDVVTAFASFHWFNDKKALNEIKRVLKPHGIFFIVNKNGAKNWGEGYRQAIIKSTGQKIAGFKNNTKVYNPIKDLKTANFTKIKIKTWKQSELFTLANALEYVQSVSIWNSVPKKKRQLALNGLRKYFQELLKRKGKIERKLTLKAISAYKK